ncbi:MAG TPA: hypothetical protein DEF45_18350 [Rhodopirellula sp.]|nr:hypothetical protein [Rhodopirellula sp.]
MLDITHVLGEPWNALHDFTHQTMHIPVQRVRQRSSMKRLSAPLCLLALAFFSAHSTASAQNPAQYGFLPFGFYQPYGANYGTSLKTPPYFALNPPVYYGTRHARPYGLSPFASPPMVTAGENYQSRLRVQFQQPRVPTPGPASRGDIRCNPCLEQRGSIMGHDVIAPAIDEVQTNAVGTIKLNPFVTDDNEELASK